MRLLGGESRYPAQRRALEALRFGVPDRHADAQGVSGIHAREFGRRGPDDVEVPGTQGGGSSMSNRWAA